VSEGPPLEQWMREAAVDELARIAGRLPFEDFDRGVQPRLARLTPEQRAVVEEGLVRLLELVQAQDTRRASGRLLDLLGWALGWPEAAPPPASEAAAQ
jgi:hypothetical protein